MAISQLGLYNEALRLIGERQLASLAENRESRRVLDNIWNDGAIDYCLEQGQWNFAIRAVSITPSTTTPEFGFVYAFDRPSDSIRTVGIAEDEFFNTPLTQVQEETGFWFANINPIYVRYVSNAASYGNDMTRWPQTFSKFVAAYLASEAVLSLTQSEDKQKVIYDLMQRRLRDARSKDAMSEATAFLPQGRWSAARMNGRRSIRNDRGNNGSLIG